MAVSKQEQWEVSRELNWLTKCTCGNADPKAFFVNAGEVIDPVALNISRACPSRREEVIFAYTRDIRKGFFGGLSAGQRRRLSLEEALDFITQDAPDWEQVPAEVRAKIVRRTHGIPEPDIEK